MFLKSTLIAIGLLVSPVCFAAEEVAPLTAHERSVIGEALVKAKKGSITIVCGGPWCRSAADGVATLFTEFGWTVGRINSGGVGIDGLAGIRVTSCRGDAAGIAKILDSASHRAVEVVNENCGGDETIYLVIGQP